MKKPAWLRVKAPTSGAYRATEQLVQSLNLTTVCQEAACPNVGECWAKGHATVMILGDTCTRACRFCNIKTGVPLPVDPQEPDRIARLVQALGLKHVVITSVDRDDLPDGGATHFTQVLRAVRKVSATTTLEILTPDFLHKPAALDILLEAPLDVFNHNLETIPRLYPSVRPGARYFNSLHLLKTVKEKRPALFTKSGLMVGLGETFSEVSQVMDDLREADVDFLTLGQYLQPTPNHHAVADFVTPDTFQRYKDRAQSKGFFMVAAGPLVRSSYHAGEDFQVMQKNRQAFFDRNASADSRQKV